MIRNRLECIGIDCNRFNVVEDRVEKYVEALGLDNVAKDYSGKLDYKCLSLEFSKGRLMDIYFNHSKYDNDLKFVLIDKSGFEIGVDSLISLIFMCGGVGGDPGKFGYFVSINDIDYDNIEIKVFNKYSDNRFIVIRFLDNFDCFRSLSLKSFKKRNKTYRF